MDSAVGADDVSYCMVAAIQSADPELLPKLFGELLYQAVFPKQWKEARCVPIPKQDKTDASNPSNLKKLRPISLLSCREKPLEMILAARLAQAGCTTGAITNKQYGSLSHRSSIDALMTNLTTTQKWLRKKSTHNKPATAPPC